ncbi:MAG: hypothetical protein ACTSYA_09140 [Candidatus Kariarchaeaceae archaeon]
MSIYEIIQNSSVLFWFLLALTQLKGKYKWFFIVLGFTDSISMFMWKILGLMPSYIFLSFAFLLPVTLFIAFFDRYKYFLIPVGLLLIYPATLLSFDALRMFLIVSQMVVVLYFGREFIVLLFSQAKINLFYIAISIYALVNILRMILVTIEDWGGVDLSIMSLIFNVLLMSPFLFIRHDDERLSIKIKSNKNNQN